MRVISLHKFKNQVIKRMPVELKRQVVKIIHEQIIKGVQVVINEIEAAKAVDSGEMRSSVSYELLSDGGIISVDAPHAKFIEYGTRPGGWGYKALFTWCVRKLGLEEKEAKKVAYAIAVSIYRNGIKPRFFFKKAFDKILARVYQKTKKVRDL